MKDVTVSIDEGVLLRAEEPAASLETSVSDVVAEYLRQWTSDHNVNEARRVMSENFSQPNWSCGVGTPDTREQRSAHT